MNKSKVLICFSAVISIFMCALTSSTAVFFTDNLEYNSDLLNEIVSGIFNLDYMKFLNVIFITIFAFNFASIILYLLKADKMVRVKKISSLWSILLLIMSLLVFILYAISYITTFHFNETLARAGVTFKDMSYYWIPKIIIFSIVILFLVFVQGIMIKKSKSVRLTKKFIMTNIYIASFMFLTFITFFTICEPIDYFIAGYWGLKTSAFAPGNTILVIENANVKYYLLYLLPITLIYSISMLLIRRKSKNKANIT